MANLGMLMLLSDMSPFEITRKDIFEYFQAHSCPVVWG